MSVANALRKVNNSTSTDQSARSHYDDGEELDDDDDALD